GATHDQRVDSLSAASFERVVSELATTFNTFHNSRTVRPTHTTAYMSESAADLPPQPFENRGVYGLLAAYPAPSTAGLARGGTAPVVAPLRHLAATGRR